MLEEFRMLSRLLGRREALTYSAIAVLAGAVAPLTGCSGSSVAFSRFATGRWRVLTSYGFVDGGTLSLTVSEDGTWSYTSIPHDGDPEPGASGRAVSGTWRLTDEGLTVNENGRDEERGTVSSISEKIDPDTIDSLTWVIPSHRDERIVPEQRYDLSIHWDKDSKELTLLSSRDDTLQFSCIASKAD